MVKLFASEEILKVAQHAVELHGGNGVMLDFGVEKLFRDAAIFLHMDAHRRHLEIQDREVDVSRHTPASTPGRSRSGLDASTPPC